MASAYFDKNSYVNSKYILPLGVLIIILVLIVLYISKKEEPDQELEKLRIQLRSGMVDKKTFERMRNRLKLERTFAEELEKLQKNAARKSI
jgi:hypothetical protein